MRKIKTIKIDDREITVKELTAEEVQQIMDGLDDMQAGIIDMLFPDRVLSSVIKKSTGLTEEQLCKMAPSELNLIIDRVEEINPTFAGLLSRLAQIGKNYLETESEKRPAD